MDHSTLKEECISKKSKLTDNARVVLAKRYLRKNDQGETIETPEEMFFRVAENIASAEKKSDVENWTRRFYDIMANLEFLPNSPTLMNAGRDIQQLSACFVLPVKDSMEDIFDAVKWTALIHKSGGGTGFSFSNLRPANDRVKSTKGVSSGPISFMRVFDVATDTVKQGGTRRGANMGLLRCDHPDIMEFISVKEKDGVLSNFNISIAITKQFMDALEKNEEYPLINPRSKEVVQYIKASEVFEKIVDSAWRNGEPGIIFIDEIEAHNPTPHIDKLHCVNPCGEQPLLSMESCNLGSINLSNMLKSKEGSCEVDYAKLGETIHTAVRFLDNVIEKNKYPLPQIDEMTKSNRKIGVGVMGFSDMLIKLGIPYNSPEAITTAEKVMRFIQEEGKMASMNLAKERGPFPNFKGSIYDKGPKIRNATVTTIAPTGTLSMIASCSSGVEPLFALVYEKNVMDGKKFMEAHPEFIRVAKERGFYSDDLLKAVHKVGSVKHTMDIPEDIRKIFVTAHDITPTDHVSIQAAFQKYVDNAVSKTVNFQHNATKKDVEDVYKMAYKTGCKGVTVYRDGSRSGQVLTVGSTEEVKFDGTVTVKDFESGAIIAKDIKLPNVFDNGPEHIIKREGKKFYLHFSYLPDDTKKKYPICIWIQTNHKYVASELKVCNRAALSMHKLAQVSGVNKKFINETLEKANQDYPHNRLGRMISLCLRHGVKREDILESLMNIEGDNVSTLLTAVRKFLSKTLDNGTELKNLRCPDCKSKIRMENGCMMCESPTCGWSAC